MSSFNKFAALQKAYRDLFEKSHSEHLNGIDLSDYKALPYWVDVVLVPICQCDNVFLPNWHVYYRLEQYDLDQDPVVVYYAPYWGEMWNVYRIVDNLYLCDTYVC